MVEDVGEVLFTFAAGEHAAMVEVLAEAALPQLTGGRAVECEDAAGVRGVRWSEDIDAVVFAVEDADAGAIGELDDLEAVDEVVAREERVDSQWCVGASGGAVEDLVAVGVEALEEEVQCTAAWEISATAFQEDGVVVEGDLWGSVEERRECGLEGAAGELVDQHGAAGGDLSLVDVGIVADQDIDGVVGVAGSFERARFHGVFGGAGPVLGRGGGGRGLPQRTFGSVSGWRRGGSSRGRGRPSRCRGRSLQCYSRGRTRGGRGRSGSGGRTSWRVGRTAPCARVVIATGSPVSAAAVTEPYDFPSVGRASTSAPLQLWMASRISPVVR